MKGFALGSVLLVVGFCTTASPSESFTIPRCEVVPLPNHEVSFRIDGIEKTRWHFGPKYPRPFFFPFRGPSGKSLTRMGHPGAPNHDHHRSIWIAHHALAGNDFWSDNAGTSIRQKNWNCYVDGDEAVMVTTCGWFDKENVELAEQQMVVALIPFDDNEHALEIQLTLRPPSHKSTLNVEKTNFGFLAIRVAKSLSAFFGGGTITNSDRLQGEQNVFGKKARWVDYSGPVVIRNNQKRRLEVEGITCFDHPTNPRYPTFWHVRDDGWMGASFCMQEGVSISNENPLVLRYLLYAHSGAYSHEKAEKRHEIFGHSRRFQVDKSPRPHHQFEVKRLEER